MRKTELFRAKNKLDIRLYGRNGYLVKSDGLDFVRSLKDSIAQLVFVDPPFNLDKDYGIRSRLENGSDEYYLSYMSDLLNECVRILAPGGALFLYHLPSWALKLGASFPTEMDFRHWIAVSMKNGFARGQRLYPAHYALLYYTKGHPANFARPKMKAQKCRHCGGYVKDYGGYRAIIDENGVNLSDIWEDLSPVRHEAYKHRDANELPRKLTDRVLAIAGKGGEVLVDPFAGTGTSLVSGLAKGMFFIGNDLSGRSLQVAKKRLDREQNHG